MAYRSISRIIAIQIFYSRDFGIEKNLDEIFSFITKLYNEKENKLYDENVRYNKKFVRELMDIVTNNFDKIMNAIEKNSLGNRGHKQMENLTKYILIVGIGELILGTDIKIVVDEFAEITRDLVGDHEVGYVHAVLDAFIG